MSYLKKFLVQRKSLCIIFFLPATSKWCLLEAFKYIKPTNRHPLDVAGVFHRFLDFVTGCFCPAQQFGLDQEQPLTPKANKPQQ